MKQFSQQFHKKATTSVRLDSAEQRELRERVLSYMEYHPLSAGVRATQREQIVSNESFVRLQIPFAGMFRTSMVVAVLAVLVVPFIAERSVPGDALYAVKVQFNEEVRSTLTFDSYQKVEWETERLNRRIAEARLLASEGRLTDQVEQEVAEAVRVHAENAKREIEVLRAEDADDAEIATIALNTTLEVQSAALRSERTDENGEVTTDSAENLIANSIDASRDGVEQTEEVVLPAYEKLMARVEQNTTRIYELRDALQAVASEEELADVNRRLADLDRLVAEAMQSAEGDEEQARKQLVEVLQRTQKLIVFMTELEVAKTVDIDTIVPVVLTDEEKRDEMSRLTNEIAQKQEQIGILLERADNAALEEKVRQTQADIAARQETLASSTEDFAAFTTLASETLVLAGDTLSLLTQYVEGSAVEVPVVDDRSTSTTETVPDNAASSTIDGVGERSSTTEQVASGTVPVEFIDNES